MRVIDTRGGSELAVGATVTYPDGEAITLLEVEPGFLSARARVRMTYRDYSNPNYQRGQLVTKDAWTPLAVRWTHPGFFLQHVGFLPS